MEKVVSLPPARNYQVHSKSFMADQAALKLTDVKKKLIQRQKKTAEHCNKCHALREHPPMHAIQRRQLGTSNCECEASWS